MPFSLALRKRIALGVIILLMAILLLILIAEMMKIQPNEDNSNSTLPMSITAINLRNSSKT
jgi:hypothetical protein